MDRKALKRLSKNELVRIVLDLSARVEALETQAARSRKNSSTSSKPPSSDIVKPVKPTKTGGTGKRKIGGQPGHDKHDREPFGADEIDEVVEYAVGDCPDCDGPLEVLSSRGRVLQQVELVERPFMVTEYVSPTCWCRRCQVRVEAAFPPGVERGGLFGPHLSAFVGYLKGGCHASYRTVQSLLADVLGVRVSTGFLAKVVSKASGALEQPYDELRANLHDEAVLNVDETGHKDCGKRYWTWCFRAGKYTVFHVDPSRGSSVLRKVLGESFGGVLGADYFSAYHKYMADGDVRVQFCFAHLIRDVRFLTTLIDKATKRYGERVLKAIKGLFELLRRKELMDAVKFRMALEKVRKKVIREARRAPARSEAQNLAERFKKNASAYFEFISTPGVEPTNNLAEQAIRFVVIDRKVTQGTRGQKGREWSERIWTTMATCAQQSRSAFGFLADAVEAHFEGRSPPSLLSA